MINILTVQFLKNSFIPNPPIQTARCYLFNKSCTPKTINCSIMKKLLSLAAGCCILFACNNQSADQSTKTDSAATAAAETKPGSSKDVEFADAKYMDIGKDG